MQHKFRQCEKMWAQDDITGEPLDPNMVAHARAEDIDFIKRICLYEEADIRECYARTGRAPISTKWADIAKDGDARSRRVARDFKPHGEKDRADLFAAMPPLEAKRLLFRHFAIHANRSGENKLKLLFIDVKKAHLNPSAIKKIVLYNLPRKQVLLANAVASSAGYMG